MNAELHKGLVRISDHPDPQAEAQKYWLDSPEYQHACREGRPYRGAKRWCKFACVIGRDLYVQRYALGAEDQLPTPPVQLVQYPPLRIPGLRDYQDKALASWSRSDFGMLCAAAGSGKTVVGCRLIHLRGVRALVIVPTIDIAPQWAERAREFLGLEAGILVSLSGQVSVWLYGHALESGQPAPCSRLDAGRRHGPRQSRRHWGARHESQSHA